jgi:hypothetical protein
MKQLILFILVVLIVVVTIYFFTKHSTTVNNKNTKNTEEYGYCVPTWPSKCFDCDAQMCSGQSKTNPALSSSGHANLGRM